MPSLKRKNTITDNSSKKLKLDHITIIEDPSQSKLSQDKIWETILRIECGMGSREMLNECKERYISYKTKSKEMIEFLNLMKCKKTIEDEMNLYRLVYKIEKTLLNNKNLS